MSLPISFRPGPLVLGLGLMLAMAPAFAADTPAPGDNDVIVSATPMPVEAEDFGAHGQLVVAPEILSTDTRADLIFTITVEPRHGRVGLAGGGEEADFFNNKTSRLGYFAYRAQDDYVGEDSFDYTVRNATSGLVFRNTVVITVKPAAPVLMERFEVGAARERSMSVREVSLLTRPNLPVVSTLPSHEDFMTPADRSIITNAKVAYQLDEQAKPQHGTARLDRATGQLTYAPGLGA